jgi:hypothetical protein
MLAALPSARPSTREAGDPAAPAAAHGAWKANGHNETYSTFSDAACLNPSVC